MRLASAWWVKLLVNGLMAAAAATAGHAASAPPPIEHFTRPPAIEGVAVSPSSKRLALLVFGSDGRRRLGVMDLQPIGKPRVVAAYADADVTKAYWVSDDRLVFEAFQAHSEIREGGAGTFAVNHDGTDARQLIAWRTWTGDVPGTAIRSRTLPYGWFLHSLTDDASNDVFVYQQIKDSLGDLKSIQLARLSTTTGALSPLSLGAPDGALGWLLDGKREPRMLTTAVGGRRKVYWRGPGSDTWTEVADFDPLKEAGVTPWFVEGASEVLVTSRMSADTVGLYRLNPATKHVDPEPVLSIAGFDLNPAREIDSQTGHLVGLHFEADRPMSLWFNADLQRIQRGVDAALPPGRSNRLYCGRCESTRFIVVRSSSDRQPGEYFLFDRDKSSLEFIGASRPWINEASQGRRTFHRVATRDGLPMPVYVTHPPDAKSEQALPAVVLVHGGPWSRGSDLGWDAEAQFLASRGYRVIQPEFRGSDGYGFRLFKAGWREWGRAMQDDLVDAVKWAAQQRLIDPAKVCIAGSSYGGYAALMAPIASPGVYRCAASFAGVTDIGLMYDMTWSDISEASRKFSMPVLIGDPDKDADRLATASPLQRAAEIKIPLLVAHGFADRRVPIEHARKFIASARRAGVLVEQVDYPDEGHGFVVPSNHADYFGRLERFLEKSLQTPH